MIGLLSTEKNEKQISVKYFLLTCFVCVSMFAWLGLSNLRADEDDTEDNSDTAEVSFQNTAQAQHADNVARQAALQDPEVIELIESGNIEEAKELFYEKVEQFTRQLSDMRASGMGWGNIAHEFGVHPSVLGLGHSPIFIEEILHFSKHSRVKSEIKEATARNFKGGIAKGHGVSGSKMGQKDSGLVYAKSYRKNQGKGIALGQSKDNNRGGGYGGGNGGGHGGGHGGGNGGGHK